MIIIAECDVALGVVREFMKAISQCYQREQLGFTVSTGELWSGSVRLQSWVGKEMLGNEMAYFLWASIGFANIIPPGRSDSELLCLNIPAVCHNRRRFSLQSNHFCMLGKSCSLSSATNGFTDWSEDGRPASIEGTGGVDPWGPCIMPCSPWLRSLPSCY